MRFRTSISDVVSGVDCHQQHVHVCCFFHCQITGGWPVLAPPGRESVDWSGSNVEADAHRLALACGPFRLDLDCAFGAGGIMAKARPRPIPRSFNQATRNRVPAQIAQLFDALLLAPDIEVVLSHLPEGLRRAVRSFHPRSPEARGTLMVVWTGSRDRGTRRLSCPWRRRGQSRGGG